LSEIEPALGQMIQQTADHLGILGSSLHQAQYELLSEGINADRRNQMLPFEDSAVNQQGAELHMLQGTGHQLFELFAAGLHKAFAHGAFLSP
jgi:hypothetical protein